jgi:hypothetical protein
MMGSAITGEQANSRWLRLLPIRWAFGGLLLGTVWSLISSLLQGSFTNPAGGQVAGLLRLLVIIILPLTALGLIWGYTERAKIDRSANQGAASLLVAIRRTIWRQVWKAMICGLAFGLFVRFFTTDRTRAHVPWDTPDHIAENIGQATGPVLLAVLVGLVVGYTLKQNLFRKFGGGST